MIKITTNTAPTATSQGYTYEIVEKLCKKYCENSSFSPQVTNVWSTKSTEVSNGVTYATIQCVTTVVYLPKGACGVCGQQTNTFIETFIVSFTGSGTVVATGVNAYTEPTYENSCCSVAQGIRNIGTVTIAFSES